MEFKLLENYSQIDEWIVEKMCEYNKRIVIAKIFVPSPTIHLNNQQLEIIWDLLNWHTAGYKLNTIDTECFYKGYEAVGWDINGPNEVICTPMGINNPDDKIFIRKNHDFLPSDFGYWINNKNISEKGKWIYTTRERFQEYMRITYFK